MAQLDALRFTEEIRARLVDFALDAHPVRDERLRGICTDIWRGAPEGGGLLGDLWVEGAFPSKTADATLKTLADTGHFDRDLQQQLDTAERMPGARTLYRHQYEAIRAAREVGPRGERPALVVTAGTGTGKTEAFMLPALDDLYRRPRQEVQGMRCLILYPMNALVNDQVDRLYGWLQGQSRVRLFHFTSETPENAKRANDDDVPTWKECRMRTRQEARGLEDHAGRPVDVSNPASRGPIPDIVITNYSMLEYMLCRPQDAPFFGPGLRTIVLDEAHLYTGTLADEITLLLRRVLLRCGLEPRDVLQIAGSATLTSDAAELRDFAGTIFGKPSAAIQVISGERDRVRLAEPMEPAKAPTPATFTQLPWPSEPLIVADESGEPSLAVSKDLSARLREFLLPHVVGESALAAIGPSVIQPAAVLRRALAAAPIAHDLEDILWRRDRIPLRELSRELWPVENEEAVQATVVLLRLLASAREYVSDYPLAPHRIHLMTRSTEGLSLCLNGNCAGPANRKMPTLGAVQSGVTDHCAYCGAAALTMASCRSCGEWFFIGREEQDRLLPAFIPPWRPRDEAPEEGQSKQKVGYTLRREVNGDVLVIGSEQATISGAGADGVRLTRITECPHCGDEPDNWRFFASGVALTLAILAETALAALPEYPSANNRYLPARGRRMLAFSDSRPEAARLGPRLTYQHETQLVRAAIIRMVSRQTLGDAENIEELRQEIADLAAQLAGEALSVGQRQRKARDLEAKRLDLQGYESGGTVGDWSRLLSLDPMLDEVLDPTEGERQQATQEKNGIRQAWSQEDWQANGKAGRLRAAMFLGREFVNPIRTAVTAETLGFVEVTYPGLAALVAPSGLLGILPTEEVRQCLRESWTGMLAGICDTLRMDGAITLGSIEADEHYQFGRVLIGRWITKSDDQGFRLIRFVGSTPRQRRRRFVATVLQACGMGKEVAADTAQVVLEHVFDQLLGAAFDKDAGRDTTGLVWLRRSDRQRHVGQPVAALQMLFPHLGLRRPTALYRCGKTAHIWPRSVLGCAPEVGSEGTLEPVGADTLDSDPRIARQRKEYRESPIFTIGLWAAEHSAQLSPGENRRLQDLFKAGIRNILSATTTLELGIDIGGLNAVLMSNVPPGKANYLQRAGRAGRRADGSSIVLTFARPRPFDLAVFNDFARYLNKDIRRPRILLDRERVVRRHFHALLLNQFFRNVYAPGKHVGAMQAFGSMVRFTGSSVPEYWSGNQKPALPELEAFTVPPLELPWWRTEGTPTLADQFRNYLTWLGHAGRLTMEQQVRSLLADTCCTRSPEPWSVLLESAERQFSQALSGWSEEYEPLATTWRDCSDKRQANAVRYQLKALSELTVIEALADHQFLPHYGFPIGVQKLRVIVPNQAPDSANRGRIREEDQYRLERGSLMALQEYVPDSQLLAAGKLVTSRGLLKHWTGSNMNNYLGLRGQCRTCVNGHFFYEISGALDRCPVCGGEGAQHTDELLFPKHGFTSAAWDPPKWSVDVERVGIAQTATMTFAIASSDSDKTRIVESLAGLPGLRAQYREDGQILVYNRGEKDKGFAICLECGFADSEYTYGEGTVNLPSDFKSHAAIQDVNPRFICAGVKAGHVPFRNQMLAAYETTDVLLVDFSHVLGDSAKDLQVITTLGFALQLAAARQLELDSREIGVMTIPVGEGGRYWGAMLYDNVPGGAGHVRELLDEQSTGNAGEWLRIARDVLYVDELHHTRCETACLQCLLSFGAQQAMAKQLLNRRAALIQLDALLMGESLPVGAESAPVPAAPTTYAQTPVLSQEDCLRRATQRQAGRR